MEITCTEHLIVPKLEKDNTFTMDVVFLGEKIKIISNDTGPVFIALDGRIIPKTKAIT